MEEQKLTEQLKACADLFYQNHEKRSISDAGKFTCGCKRKNADIDRIIGAITGEYRNDNAAEGKR